MSRQLSLFPELEGAAEKGHPGTQEPQPKLTGSGVATESVAGDCQPSSSFRMTAGGLERLQNPPFEALCRKLASWLQEPLATLVLTDNRRRIISARPTKPGLEVRIHRSFLEADDTTVHAVAIFLNSRKGEMQRTLALQTIRSYFDHQRPTTPSQVPPLRLQPKGRHVDLRHLRDRLNKRYFDDALEVHITWGRAPKVRRRRGRGFSILLGSYTETDHLVRIHPCLDQADVPEYVVESVVYHEMLHAALPSQRHNGRRRLHTPEFRRREALYHHAREANQWLEDNLSRLAASR